MNNSSNINLSTLQNTQEQKEIIVHQNSYTDRSYNKQGNNQISSNLQSLVSPKLQKKTELSPIKQEQVSFRQHHIKNNSVQSQKLFPTIKSPQNQQEQFYFKDGFKQNQYYNQDVISCRDKPSYNTILSRYNNNESLNPVNVFNQKQIMSQRNSLPIFKPPVEINNELNKDPLQNKIYNDVIDQSLKQQKETNTYNIFLNNKQKIEQRYLNNSKNQSLRQSLDERSNINKNIQNIKKPELNVKLDFSQYCQLKQQVHSSYSTTEYQFPNSNTQLKNKTINLEQNAYQNTQSNKKMEDDIYFKQNLQKIQDKNNSRKVSSSLDTPNLSLIGRTNPNLNNQGQYMYSSQYQHNQKVKQGSSERKSLLQTFNIQKSDQYFTPVSTKAKLFMNNTNLSQDDQYKNSFIKYKNSLGTGGIKPVNLNSQRYPSKEQQNLQADKNINNPPQANNQISSLTHINQTNQGSKQVSEAQVSQEISQSMLKPQNNQKSLINLQNSQSNYNSSTKQSLNNNQNNSSTLNQENSISPIIPFNQNALSNFVGKQSQNNSLIQQQSTESKVKTDNKNQNLVIVNQSPENQRINNSSIKVNTQDNANIISPQNNVYSSFINSLNFKNGFVNNDLSHFNNMNSDNLPRHRITIDQSQLSRQDKPLNKLYFPSTPQNKQNENDLIQPQFINSNSPKNKPQMTNRQQNQQNSQRNQSEDISSYQNQHKKSISKTLQDRLNPLNLLQNEQNNSKQMSDLSQNNSQLDNSQQGLDNSNVDSNSSQNKSKWKLNHQHVYKYKKKLKHNVDQFRRYSYSNNSDYILNMRDNISEGPSFGSDDLYNQQSLENSADMESSKLSNFRKISSKKDSTIKPPDSVNVSQDSIISMEDNVNISSQKINESKEEKKLIRDIKNPLQNKYDNVSTSELCSDPLFKDYSSTQVVRSFKKKHSYNYALSKQATIISLGNQKLNKLSTTNFGANDDLSESQSQIPRSMSRKQTLSVIPSHLSDNKLERKETLTFINPTSNQAISVDEIKSSSSISIQNIPTTRRSIINIIPVSNSDIPYRSESERKVQLKEQRDQQLEQIQNKRRTREKKLSLSQIGDNSKYQLEVVPMGQIQENEDEMYSPQPDYNAIRKRTQTLCVPQLKVSDQSQSSSQSPSPVSNSPSKKKTFNEKTLKKYLNIIKVDLTNYFVQALKLTDEKEKIASWTNCCLDLVKTVTAPILTSVSKDKFDQLSEEHLKQVGDFIKDKFLEYNFDLQQVFLFQKKFNFMVSQIFRRNLLDQIENEVPLNELIDEIVTRLSDKIPHFKKFEQEELENIKQAVIALLSNNKEILLYYLDMYKPQMNIEPLDFFVIKYTIFNVLESKKYSFDVIFDVLEKIEKLRNYLFPHYQFSDSNFRKNLACLILFNKVLSGYFLDPSIQTMQEFIHNLWNCLHGFDSFERFIEAQKRLVKTQLNSKFYDLLQDFILENMPKSLTHQEIQDLKFKFFKLKQVTNALQMIPTLSSSTTINTKIILDELKEVALMKAISKQIPLELTESKVFDFRYFQIFFDFAIKSNKEVISVFETNQILSSFFSDLQTINYQFELLKHPLITLGVEQNFIDEITNIFQFLVISYNNN